MDSFLDVVNYDMLRIYSDSRALKDDLDNNSNLIISIWKSWGKKSELLPTLTFYFRYFFFLLYMLFGYVTINIIV